MTETSKEPIIDPEDLLHRNKAYLQDIRRDRDRLARAVRKTINPYFGDHTMTTLGMTPVYTEEQIANSFDGIGIAYDKRRAILANLRRKGPHSTIMSRETADQLGVGVARTYLANNAAVTLSRDYFEEQDILRALENVALDADAIDEILDNVKRHRDDRICIRRIKVDDLHFTDRNKKIRFPAATIPTWMTLTDVTAFQEENGRKHLILVLNGKTNILDPHVAIDIDDRKEDISND